MNENTQKEGVIKIPWAKPYLRGNEKQYLLDALDSGWISSGKYAARFEKEFARHHSRAFAILTSSGTSALHLVLMALGIGPGDEVIVPSFSFMAAANMVMACGATCVYADIDSKSWCLDPESVSCCISSKTKAVIAVHLYGNVCDMDALTALAQEHRVVLIEDVAQAPFSQYRGRYAGTFGHAAIFSFQAAKTIAMGEGGCVLTDDSDAQQKICLLRDHGMRKDKRYWHDAAGYNFRLTDLQAAIGCAQLENMKFIIERKRNIFESYGRYLSGEPGLTMQFFSAQVKPVVWTVAVRIEESYFKKSRDFLIQALRKRGIETRPGFYPVDAMPLYQAPSLPVARLVGLHVISLPSFPEITEEEIFFVCQQLKSLTREA